MRGHRSLHTLLNLCLLVLAVHCAAQPTLLFDRLGAPQGLPGTEIYALLEDREGRIWVGTEAGLARMEGTRVRVWQHDPRDSTSLSNQRVSALAEDELGNIWVATAHGFQRHRPQDNQFERFHMPRSGPQRGSDRIYSLTPDGRGGLWLVTDEGLWCFDTKTRSFKRIRASEQPGTGPFCDRVMLGAAVVRDPKREGLWLCTKKGLAFLDHATGEWYGPRHDPKNWGCFEVGDVAAATLDGRGGLWWFDAARFQLVHWPSNGGPSVRVNEVNGQHMHFTPQWMRVTRDGALWMSTWTYRCLRYDPSRGGWLEVLEGADDPSRLGTSNVKSFLEDRRGDLWFGTYNGLDVAPSERRILTMHGNVVPEEAGVITAQWSAGGDTLLLGTRSGALYTWNGSEATPFRSLGPTAPTYVNQLARRNARSVWVATSRGPWIADRESRSLSPWTAAPEALMRSAVMAMHTDRRGDTWAVTWNRGVFVHRAATGNFEHFTDTVAGDRRLPWRGGLCVLEDTNGDLLVGLNQSAGLCRFPQGQGPVVHYLNGDDGDPSSCGTVLSMTRAGNGMLWAGTHEGGVARLDLVTGKFNQYTHADGLPNDRVNDVMIDDRGRLWALTARGIACLPNDGDQFLPLPLPSGLDPRRMAASFVRLPDGRICTAVDRTLVFIDPQGSGQERQAPGTYITSIRAGDNVFWSGGSPRLKLPHDQRTLQVAWGMDDPLHAFTTSYAYRLLPDTHWTSLGDAGRIDLSGLPSGTHRLEVRASLDGRTWGPSAVSPLITVLPPMHRTWWFLALATLVVLAIIGLSVRLYVQRRLAAQRLVFEREQALLAERMRIAGDMHDDLGAGLSGLKLRSEMAARSETDPAKRTYYVEMARQAGELIGSMRQIIWAMNSDQGSLEDLVAYATGYARNYLAENGLEAHITAEGPWPGLQLTTEQRRNLFLVLKEALHNVVKHAQAHRVRITIAWQPDGDHGTLEVTVADDGIGLSNGGAMAGNGSRNMRQRTVALGGTFEINTENGSTVKYAVPLAPTNKGSIAESLEQPHLRTHVTRGTGPHQSGRG
jgi:signal transduction histidine kinase/ligand-binding sensor domain-containing protein